MFLDQPVNSIKIKPWTSLYSTLRTEEPGEILRMMKMFDVRMVWSDLRVHGAGLFGRLSQSGQAVVNVAEVTNARLRRIIQWPDCCNEIHNLLLVWCARVDDIMEVGRG